LVISHKIDPKQQNSAQMNMHERQMAAAIAAKNSEALKLERY
jgi:hypothetical protein